MKGKFGKVGLLCLAVLMGVGAMGVALAYWQKPLNMETNVSTGKWIGCVVTGGDGGVFNQHLKVHALSLIDDDTIIFATDKKDAQFKGWGDTYWGAPFSKSDLWSLNMCTGTSQLYLDGDWIMANPKYEIRSAHYYQEEGLDYLLMTINSGSKDKDKVGTPPASFNKNDIFILHIDPADPDYKQAEFLYSIGDDPEVRVVALCRRDDGIILFSTHGDATIAGIDFKEGTVIKFNPGADLTDPSDDTYTELFYDEDILPGEQDPEIHALATLPWPDERLLLVFNKEVTGNNDISIFSEDIAIWDIDTINLHISMRDF